ncbi:hypothetical protein IAT38_007623 [Cryptococcus sp. DSM 104549]
MSEAALKAPLLEQPIEGSNPSPSYDGGLSGTSAVPGGSSGPSSVTLAGKGTNHLDVEEELAFYASYHSNEINQIIHFLCIPQILWSFLILISHFSLPGTRAHVLAPGLAVQPNLSLAWITSYVIYYIILEPIAGLTYIPVGTIMYLTATYLANYPPAWLPFSSAVHPTAVPFAWSVHALAWIAQFIGHGFFEHRAPALTDNLVQPLVLAPYFVHLEFLFSFFNYKPQLHRKIKSLAGKRIVEMNRAKRAKQAASK